MVVMSPKKSFEKVVRIYCEGDTEKKYLVTMFTDRYKGLRAQFKPKIKGSIEHILEGFLQELYEPETKALKGLFLVLDMDTLYTQSKISIYKQMKKKLEAIGDSSFSIIESRPCIEYWFLLHFVFQDKLFVNCDSVLKELKKKDRLPDYDKHGKYTKDLYEKLKKDIDVAIKNSIKVLEKPRQADEQHSYTYMHEMITTLDDIYKS
ncbi:MAG: RloB family protein [Candidatus Cloacimonadaceae bacterium]|nr:RloB family protein [Candidatus Cloacimonadaceae bacterium]